MRPSLVLARHISPQLQSFIEGKLEGWLGLQLNREKTRILNLQSPGQSLDFLGYTFRYDRDRLGRAKRYWNLTPSRKAVTRERAVLHEKLSLRRSQVPLLDLLAELNCHLRGWARYYSLGYPRKAMRDVNAYVLRRLAQHLKRRSQRGWKAPADQSDYRYVARMGLLTPVNAADEGTLARAECGKSARPVRRGAKCSCGTEACGVHRGSKRRRCRTPAGGRGGSGGSGGWQDGDGG